MAQKIVTIITDDLTGEESDNAATHTFELDGVAYEIDLGPDSHEQLLQALAPFMKAGRKAGKTKARVAKRQTRAASADDTASVREWAKDQGYAVKGRGRVRADIREAYEKAQST